MDTKFLTKDYYAFISYKREDEKWASWVQNKIEHYRFPTNLNGEISLPSKIHPTFRDVTDITPGLLSEEIDNALRNSEWLIVICSPRSAKSPWVCKEAQSFIDSGRSDHIIPFIIEGTPGSNNPETECFPSSLLQLTDSQELLAANINEMGRDAAVVKVVARMFNLRFDTLWQRYNREQKRKRRLWTWLIIILLLLSLVVTAYISGINIRLDKTNNELHQALDNLNKANEEVKSERDKTIYANKRLQVAHDSIKLQEDSLQKAYDRLSVSEQNLEENNFRLKVSKDSLSTVNGRLENTTSSLLTTQSRFVAEKALSISKKNSYLARKLAVEVLPKDLKHPDRPYTVEAEKALRMASKYNSQIIRGHLKPLTSVAYSPDGTLLATSSLDKTVKIWNVHTGALVQTLSGHQEGVTSVCFSPDGKFLVSGSSDWSAKIWVLSSGKCFKTLIGHSDAVNSIAVSPDGQFIVTGSSDQTARLWNFDTGKRIHILDGHKNSIESVSFSPDGCFVATGAPYDNAVKIWDVKSGECTTTLDHTSTIECLDMSPDGKTVAAGSLDDTVVFWNLENGQSSQPIKANSTITAIKFSPDGRYILVADFISLTIWDISTKEPSHYRTVSHHKTLTADLVLNNVLMELIRGDSHSEYIADIAWSPDGNNVVMASETAEIIEIFADEGKSVLETGHFRSCSFSQDGSLLAVVADNKIQIWDVKTDECVHNYVLLDSDDIVSPLDSPDGKFYSSRDGKDLLIKDSETLKTITICKGDTALSYEKCWSQDSKFIAVSYEDFSVKIWKADDAQCIQTLKGHSEGITSICFSPDGKLLATGSWDHTVRIWDVSSGNCINQIILFPYKLVSSMCFSPDGKLLLTGFGDGNVAVWNVSTIDCLKTMTGHKSNVKSFHYSPNGKFIVTGSRDSTARLWNAETYDCINTFALGETDCSLLSFSSDGKYIIANDFDKSKIWEISSGKTYEVLRAFRIGKFQSIEDYESLRSLYLSKDGKYLVGLQDYELNVWDFPTREHYKGLIGHRDFINSCDFSADGEYVVTSSEDSTAIVWSLQTGKKVQTLKGHRHALTDVSCSPDGKLVLTGSYDNTAKIWNISNGMCVRTLAGHNSYVMAVCCSPDGKHAATGSWDNTAKIWDMDTGDCICTLEGNTDHIEYVEYTPDGNYLLTRSSNQSVKVWDVISGQCIYEMADEKYLVASFSPNNRTLCLSNASGGVRLLDFPPLQELIDTTRERFKNCSLTDEERKLYYTE